MLKIKQARDFVYSSIFSARENTQNFLETVITCYNS